MGVAHNLDELKNLIGPLAVYQDYVRLTARGRRRVGLCPFHKEKTPSFSVDEENGLFYCFGCHKGGDMIQFVQEMEGVGFKEALELLARKAGVDLEWRSPGGGQRDQAPDRKERLRKCLQSARDYYRGCLVAAPKGAPVKAYVDRRGIAPATEESLQLGFAPRAGRPPGLPEEGGVHGGGGAGGGPPARARPGRVVRALPQPAHLPHRRPPGEDRRLRRARPRRRGAQVPELAREPRVPEARGALRPQLDQGLRQGEGTTGARRGLHGLPGRLPGRGAATPRRPWGRRWPRGRSASSSVTRRKRC